VNPHPRHTPRLTDAEAHEQAVRRIVEIGATNPATANASIKTLTSLVILALHVRDRAVEAYEQADPRDAWTVSLDAVEPVGWLITLEDALGAAYRRETIEKRAAA